MHAKLAIGISCTSRSEPVLHVAHSAGRIGHPQASARWCRWTSVRRVGPFPVVIVIAVILATLGVVAIAHHYYSHHSCHFGSACYTGVPKRLQGPCWSPFYPDSPGYPGDPGNNYVSFPGSPTTAIGCAMWLLADDLDAGT
jgi:hypothetical protein